MPMRKPPLSHVSPPCETETTGSASSTTMASRISVPAMTPRKLFHGSGRRRRASVAGGSLIRGSRPNSVRAAPAVTTDPVMTMPRAGEPVVVAGLLDQRGRGLDGVGQRRAR